MLAKQLNQKRVLRITERAARLTEKELVGTARKVLQLLLERFDVDDRQLVRCLLAECMRISGDYFSALEVLKGGEQSPRMLYIRAYCLALSGSPRDALRIALPQLREAAGGTDTADLLACVGIALYRTGHYKWATLSLERAAAICLLASDMTRLARCQVTLSLIEKNLGRHSVALDRLDNATALLSGKRLPRARMALLQNRGVCSLQLGRLTEARTYFMRAEKIAREVHNSFVLIAIHNNLGHIYRFQGNHTLCAEFYESALEGSIREKMPRKECLSLEFLAENLIETGEHERAVKLLDRAHAIAISSSGYGDLIGEVCRRRGEAYCGTGNMQAARRDLQRALKICQSRGERREGLLTQRSVALYLEEDLEEAKELLTQVLTGLRELGDRFEFSKTVFLAVTQRRFNGRLQWLTDDLATATHYFRSLGSNYWRDRLQRAANDAVLFPAPTSNVGSAKYMYQFTSQCYERANREVKIAARGHGPVCLIGESGSGKEILARAVHAISERSTEPFVPINCGALPDQLIESELFGHSKGAFTGSHTKKLGLLEVASGGFVLLDEIGDLPAVAQVKLLRFIDSGEYRRVGETEVRHADVRIIAATNKNMSDLVDSGSFREDLWFRLQAFVIRVPALRDREEDIIPLFHHFIHSARGDTARLAIEESLEYWVRQHDWPGNVRELKNVCDYLVAASWGEDSIKLEHLPLAARHDEGGKLEVPQSLPDSKEQLERTQLRNALVTTQGRISEAADLLGVGRNTVTRKMLKYKWKREDFLA